MGGSEERSRCRKNLQKDADGGELCPEYRVAGKKQGLCFPVLSLPGKGSSPCAGSPPRYHRLVPSLPQALWQQWKWAVGYKDTRSKWCPCLSCTKVSTLGQKQLCELGLGSPKAWVFWEGCLPLSWGAQLWGDHESLWLCLWSVSPSTGGGSKGCAAAEACFQVLHCKEWGCFPPPTLH